MYNNIRLTAMRIIIAHTLIMYIYTTVCICVNTRQFTMGILTFACETIGTSFICLKDVVKDVVILGVLSERRRILKNK